MSALWSADDDVHKESQSPPSATLRRVGPEGISGPESTSCRSFPPSGTLKRHGRAVYGASPCRNQASSNSEKHDRSCLRDGCGTTGPGCKTFSARIGAQGLWIQIAPIALEIAAMAIIQEEVSLKGKKTEIITTYNLFREIKMGARNCSFHSIRVVLLHQLRWHCCVAY